MTGALTSSQTGVVITNEWMDKNSGTECMCRQPVWYFQVHSRGYHSQCWLYMYLGPKVASFTKDKLKYYKEHSWFNKNRPVSENYSRYLNMQGFRRTRHKLFTPWLSSFVTFSRTWGKIWAFQLYQFLSFFYSRTKIFTRLFFFLMKRSRKTRFGLLYTVK